MNPVTWNRTADRGTWRAESGGAVLTVSRSSSGTWLAMAERGPAVRRAERPTRLAAQAAAERLAG